jgi:hypothetical protein
MDEPLPTGCVVALGGFLIGGVAGVIFRSLVADEADPFGEALFVPFGIGGGFLGAVVFLLAAIVLRAVRRLRASK